MGMKIKGLKEFEKKISNLSKKSENANGQHSVPFDELFSKKFMDKYTTFESIDIFIEKSGFNFKDMDSINENELDKFVDSTTQFNTWKKMLTKASEIWTAKKLGF